MKFYVVRRSYSRVAGHTLIACRERGGAAPRILNFTVHGGERPALRFGRFTASREKSHAPPANRTTDLAA